MMKSLIHTRQNTHPKQPSPSAAFAGALEFALSLLSMRNSVLLPTMHLREADPECDLDYVPNETRQNVEVRTCMSNSFAFGGTNAVLIAKALE